MPDCPPVFEGVLLPESRKVAAESFALNAIAVRRAKSRHKSVPIKRLSQHDPEAQNTPATVKASKQASYQDKSNDY